MPVVGTEVDCIPAANPVNCTEQTTKRPAITEYEGRPVYGRKRAVRIVQGQTAYVEVPLLNEDGQPIDLSLCVCNAETLPGSSSSSEEYQVGILDGCGVVARLVEAMSFCGEGSLIEVDGAITIAEKGVVRFRLSGLEEPGVYECQIAGFSNGEMIFTDELFVLVEQSLFGNMSSTGPPSWKDVKMAVHDSHRNDGFLMDEMEWDLAEVCQALIDPVRWWNESKPLNGPKYTTSNFPHKTMWRRGALAHLYRMAAAHYRREYLAYTAAGVALNDKAKAPEYEPMAVAFETEFKTWAFQQKTASQASNMFGVASANGCGRCC